MTEHSQNGWPINPTSRAPLVVNGVSFGPTRAGDVHTVLSYVARRFDDEVERLIPGTCGCYNPRKIPGSNVWSNHASMTAIDCNWQRHPLGAHGTFTADQVRKIINIVNHCDGVIRWGGLYTTTVDEMHFEIVKDAAAVHALAVKINTPQEEPMPTADEIADRVVAKLSAAVPGSSGPNWAQDVERTEAIERQLTELTTKVDAIAQGVNDLLSPPTA